MDKTRRALKWLLVQITGFFGFTLLIVFNPVFMLFGALRETVYIISLANRDWEKSYRESIRFLHFLFYIQVVSIIIYLWDEYLGATELYQSVLAAGVIVAFIAFQFPRMTPPTFATVYTNKEAFNRREIVVKPQTQVVLLFCITNVGLIAYKNCLFNVHFENNFKIHKPKGSLYAVTNQDRTAIFTPDKAYMTITPYSQFMLHLPVLTPEQQGSYKIRVVLSTESAWSYGEDYLRIKVAN